MKTTWLVGCGLEERTPYDCDISDGACPFCFASAVTPVAERPGAHICATLFGGCGVLFVPVVCALCGGAHRHGSCRPAQPGPVVTEAERLERERECREWNPYNSGWTND